MTPCGLQIIHDYLFIQEVGCCDALGCFPGQTWELTIIGNVMIIAIILIITFLVLRWWWNTIAPRDPGHGRSG